MVTRQLKITLDANIVITIDTTEYNTEKGKSTFYNDIVDWLKNGTSKYYIYETEKRVLSIPRDSFINISEEVYR